VVFQQQVTHLLLLWKHEAVVNRVYDRSLNAVIVQLDALKVSLLVILQHP
jgi:hypothetical protein